MIHLTDTERSKLKSLDVLFTSIDPESLKELADAETIVSRLKGEKEYSHSVINSIIDAINTSELDKAKMYSEVIGLRSELEMLKNDLRSVIQFISKPLDTYAQASLTSVKSRHGIY